MLKRIHVGNLPFVVSEEDVRALMAKHGTLHDFELVTNKKRRPRSEKSRGFAFADMDEQEADVAVEALNGCEFGGRTLSASEAKSRKKEPVFEIRDRDRDRGPRRQRR